MRTVVRVLTAAALAGGAVLVTATPASATCMETFDRYGIRMYSCGACGEDACYVSSWVCYQDLCVQTS